jgi:SAM-dependent methyltransferase
MKIAIGCDNASMKAKPKHLASKYGKQWQDRSMATAYCHRLPYPGSLFDVLQGLAESGPVLEIGAGTGHATVELARRFPEVHAIEPSAEMLAVATQLALPNVTWTQSTFEEAILSPPYTLAVAAESLHWTDWAVSLPKIAGALTAGASLAILQRETVLAAWQDELVRVIQRYSTNQDYEPYDLIDELTARKLFHVTGSRHTRGETVFQPLDDYIECFHSRNGLSRERMSPTDCEAFDSEVRHIVAPHLVSGRVPVTPSSTLHWGTPMPVE